MAGFIPAPIRFRDLGNGSALVDSSWRTDTFSAVRWRLKSEAYGCKNFV